MAQNRNYRHEFKFEIPYADYVAMRTGFRPENAKTTANIWQRRRFYQMFGPKTAQTYGKHPAAP